ncbi:TPA: hypothetical protein QC364_000995 [Bacillus cereus]|uniref:Uncharacterized protein n=1 Tax=Bacillus mobilis TaxID=2026190 RepID=A0A1Y5ZDA0_9BACI|nr:MULTISPECIES: anti-phage protein KwaA [Bacillus]MDU2389330.1 anti-phage protein KwaA [Bacillus sp. (in: firmicutes)]UTG84465.1 hypothetical protein MON10_08030 [Bacillus paranthracis]SMD93341.1 hypothetical protein BACERE00185_01814 [Bacillus mobilis]HDR8454191.1 hypothetical protein [Bacillus cereus]
MRGWVKLTLFFSSFSPLFFIIFIQNINFEKVNKENFNIDILFQSKYIAIAMCILFVIPNLMLMLLFFRCKKRTPHNRVINIISHKNNDVLNYIATYLIPFFSFKTNTISDLIAFTLLLVILSIIYINANMFYVNPILILFGYNIYEINNSFILITKDTIMPNMPIQAYKIENTVYLGERRNGNT